MGLKPYFSAMCARSSPSSTLWVGTCASSSSHSKQLALVEPRKPDQVLAGIDQQDSREAMTRRDASPHALLAAPKLEQLADDRRAVLVDQHHLEPVLPAIEEDGPRLLHALAGELLLVQAEVPLVFPFVQEA